MGEKTVEYGAGIAGIKCGHRGLYLRTSAGDRLTSLAYAKPSDCDNWETWEFDTQAMLWRGPHDKS